MTKLILYGILLYLLYKFVFELVIPVSKATTQVKDKLKEMQEQQLKQQQYQQQQQAQAAQAQAQQAKQTDVKSGDYIDFEEVKWSLTPPSALADTSPGRGGMLDGWLCS